MSDTKADILHNCLQSEVGTEEQRSQWLAELYDLASRAERITEPRLNGPPFMEIPDEVYVAAETISNYFQRQNIKDWEFAKIADRNLVTRLRQERE